jgi:hypothetical protein
MPPLAVAHRFWAALILMGLLAAAPAKAEIENSCGNATESYARHSAPPFLRHAFEFHSLKEQGYELQAVTSDGDKDGNQFVVTFMLSANSKAALKDAEPAFLAILSKY